MLTAHKAVKLVFALLCDEKLYKPSARKGYDNNFLFIPKQKTREIITNADMNFINQKKISEKQFYTP